MRALLVKVHRWAGLVLAGFLVIAGMTGSLLAWNDELEAALAPQLFIALETGPRWIRCSYAGACTLRIRTPSSRALR